jgi:CrcB protein
LSVLVWVAMALAGGAGAVARWAVVVVCERALLADGPTAIFAVNLSGALAIGVLAGAGLDGDARMVAVTGFLGGYTTFSTWMVHTDELTRNLAGPRWAAINLAASLLVGFGAVAPGMAVA